MAESVARLFEEFGDSHQFLNGMTAEQKQQLVTMSSVRTLTNRQVIATLTGFISSCAVASGLRTSVKTETGFCLGICWPATFSGSCP